MVNQYRNLAVIIFVLISVPYGVYRKYQRRSRPKVLADGSVLVTGYLSDGTFYRQDTGLSDLGDFELSFAFDILLTVLDCNSCHFLSQTTVGKCNGKCPATQNSLHSQPLFKRLTVNSDAEV